MENPVRQRIIEFIEHKGITKNSFEKSCGLAKGFINNIRNSIQPRTLERISQPFPELNIGWLLTGEGSMLREGYQERFPDVEGAPCYDIMTIQGGLGHGTGMERIMETDMAIGRMLAPGLPVDNNVFYIQVRGNSMVNHKDPSHSIPDGAWVGLKQFTSSVIRWGEVYAVMTTEGAVVKKLIPSDKDGCIRFVSYNEEEGFAPYDLPVDEIVMPIYTIVGVVSVSRWK